MKFMNQCMLFGASTYHYEVSLKNTQKTESHLSSWFDNTILVMVADTVAVS